MKVYGIVADITMPNSTQLNISARYAFNNGGTIVGQDTATFSVTQPTDVTYALLNGAIADGLASAVNAKYGTSFTRTSIILISGAVALPVL